MGHIFGATKELSGMFGPSLDGVMPLEGSGVVRERLAGAVAGMHISVERGCVPAAPIRLFRRVNPSAADRK